MARYLFVYGTLKKGESRHNLIEELGGTFVTYGYVPKYVLMDIKKSYPYMINSTDWNAKVYGELYVFADNTSFDRISEIECPGGYVPFLVDVIGENTEYYKSAVAYIFPGIYFNGVSVLTIGTKKQIKYNKIFDSKSWSSLLEKNKNGN